MSTESIDPRYQEIDSWPSVLAVEAMLEGQLAAIACIRSQTSAIADASEAAAARLLRGGRLVYVGAGTSGRIAVQDGVELAPTYNWPENRLVFLLAGGFDALSRSVEGAEDDIGAARHLVSESVITPDDVVIGVAASGRTPFTVAAVVAARKANALTIGISNNPASPLLSAAEYALCADTGSELIAGSTRMKAGTAQKAILNLFSTTTMLRCGLVYQGLMVNMRVSNEKLLARARVMVQTLSGCDYHAAVNALNLANNDIRKATIVGLGQSVEAAERLLRENNYNLRAAIAKVGDKCEF
jgi:N-acetylmuramic acid 6-phosphate etherase